MKPSDKISKYVCYGEIIRSDTARRLGISNEPDQAIIEKIKLACNNVFDKARTHFGVPLFISSCYRSPEVNKAVGGKPNSQHLRGEAIDIDCDVFGKVTNIQLFQYIRDNLDFDQLLWEGGKKGWVHVSYKATGNRKSVGTIPNP
jgi:zinc D-Ala-D-Ala carboxypeptidase